MLYFYSTRQSNNKYKNQIYQSLDDKNVKIVELVNENQYSLTECYNKAIDEGVDGEIIVFAHDDIELEQGWDTKLKNIFDTTNYGIIGVAGSTTLNDSGIWWENKQDLAGIVSHEQIIENKLVRYDTKFSEPHNFTMPVCVIDGVFIAVRKDRIKCKFNEKITGFHFYDISFSIDNFLQGVNIGVTTAFKIHHKSIGQLTDKYYNLKEYFLLQYKEKLPLKITPKIEEIAPIVNTQIQIPNTKVAVIILTKDKIDLLTNCITSIYDTTNKNIRLTFFVGDTGSNEESITKLSQYIDTNPNIDIKIIKLEKYHFATNNNYIVDTFVDDTFDLILFSNNDIKVVNNALDLMIEQYYKQKNNVGTIGCRLLYENNRIQHAGILLYSREHQLLGATHYGLKTFYYGKSSVEKNFVGCTGAFLLIKRKLFLKHKFDELTEECFEDVLLNINVLFEGKQNIYVGSAVCYHYESLTRNERPDQNTRIQNDFQNRLKPIVEKNKLKLNKYILRLR